MPTEEEEAAAADAAAEDTAATFLHPFKTPLSTIRACGRVTRLRMLFRKAEYFRKTIRCTLDFIQILEGPEMRLGHRSPIGPLAASLLNKRLCTLRG